MRRSRASRRLAADRDLQQSLLGVGRHSGAEPDRADESPREVAAAPSNAVRPAGAPIRIYVANPTPPTRWSQPATNAQIESGARIASAGPARIEAVAEPRPAARPAGPSVVIVAGTLDTKGNELRFIRDLIVASGLRTRLVDVSTSGKPATCDVTAQEIALNHGRGGAAVFGRERGASVAAMAEAFEAWIKRQGDIAGIITAGGSGGASIVAPGMRALPIGAPKVIISSIASGDVSRYVGPTDITMMYSVTDVQGLNSISRQVLANAANAIVGMAQARLVAREKENEQAEQARAVGLTMFGVTTPAVQQIS